MKDGDNIEQLRAEADRLSKQFEHYHNELKLLRRKIEQIENGNNHFISPFSSQPVPKNIIQNWNLENFIGLRLIHLAGIIILLIGLSIGVKYAIDKNLISEGLRIVLAYAAGIVLYVLSVWLKRNYKSFSAILFSGAMASIYFTTYAAFVYYQVFSFATAFVFMIGLTVYTVYEAIRYNRQEIALLGLVGAYGIPFLISQNNDKADLFFLYITLINVGIVFLSIKKRWKPVGRVAQGITWVLFIAWAAVRFDVRLQWIGFLFMSVFFFLFLLNILLGKILNKASLTLADAYAIVLNSAALYLALLFVVGYSFSDTTIAVITFCVSVITSAQAIAIHFAWTEESFVKRMLAGLALILFIIFIAF